MGDELVVVGLSHHTAPLALREQLTVHPERLAEQLGQLVGNGLVADGVIVSTCNRVEIYGTASDTQEAAERVRVFLEKRVEGSEFAGTIGRAVYARRGEAAVRHTFRVAASLDSLVVGEPQILGQVKEAYDAATTAGTVGTLLGRAFTRAFAVAKRVRSETEIAAGTVSVSSVASSLARKIFGDLRGRRVILHGAGEMGEAAAKALAGDDAALTVINRSPEKAERVAAECGGRAASYVELLSELHRADVVITSTSAQSYVLTTELMRGVAKARRGRPLFLIDIAVPRDVDPRVGDLENVFLYDVDDLQQVAQENLAQRKRAAEAAERIVETEVAEFEAWRRSLELTPTIVAMRQRYQAIVKAEIERTLPRLGDLTPKQKKALDKMAGAMVNKLLHAPMTELKGANGTSEGPILVAAAQRLFGATGGGEDQSRPSLEPERFIAPEKTKA
ncbi:MAG: glutamyl-tRNA reductase [Myxococcota bacterium]